MRSFWAITVLLVSCGGEGDAQLIVDIRTDLRGGADFVDVRTRVFRGDEMAAEREVVTPAPAARDLSTGFRVAEIGALEAGARRVEVAILDADGSTVADRSIRVEVVGTTAITASLSRSCTGVVCPGATDSPDAVACLGGQCVTAMCADGVADACEAAELSLAELLRQSVVASCEMVARCLGPAIDFAFRGDDCQSYLEPILSGPLTDAIERSLIEGRIMYHPDRAFACLAALRTGCRDYGINKRFLECVEAIEGTVPLGGECFTDFDCEGVESVCELLRCPGTCVSRGREGSACFENADCASDLKCVGGACQPIAARGEPCDVAAAACAFDDICIERVVGGGFHCEHILDFFTADAGEDCGPVQATFCLEGLSCELNAVDTVGRCGPKASSGGACVLGIPDPCPTSQYCEASTLTCTGLPTAGAPCVTVDEAPRCAPEHVCVEGSCVRLLGIGATCRSSSECLTSVCALGRCVSACG